MFADRHHSGTELARLLAPYAGRHDVIVLGLPRGGVPVAYEVAKALDAPLDVLVARKLGVPFQPELAMGAIASGGATWLNQEVIRLARVTPEEIARVEASERVELHRREALYRQGRKPLDVSGRTVILVDDGMATGASIHAAARAVRALAPSKLIVAVPVAPTEGAQRMRHVADEFVCLDTPEDFRAVGQFYRDFGQTSDAEVQTLLAQAQRRHPTAA